MVPAGLIVNPSDQHVRAGNAAAVPPPSVALIVGIGTVDVPPLVSRWIVPSVVDAADDEFGISSRVSPPKSTVPVAGISVAPIDVPTR